MVFSADPSPDVVAPHPGVSSGLVSQTRGARRLLPAGAYTTLAFQAAEDAAIWTRAWIGVGFLADVDEVGDILPYAAGNHGLHFERRADGSIAGRFNKAQHGGCRVVPLQCQTGARTHCSFTACGFSYDRAAIKANDPERGRHLDQYLGQRPERLLQISVREWGPLIVARLDPAARSPFDWPECDTIVPCGAKDHGGDTIWKEYPANWKHLAVALADRQAGDESAAILSPNVIVRKFGKDICLIVLQPTALDRTLCRVRMMTCDHKMSPDGLTQVTESLARCGARAAEMQREIEWRGGDDQDLNSVRSVFEHYVRNAIESLAAEERSDILYRTSDTGEW